MLDLRLKYSKSNIPILSNKEIDTQAELLIEDYDSSLLSKPRAIDVEDFAENYLGLHFHYTDLSHSGFIWGRMVFNDAKIIVYNSSTERPDEEPVDGNTIVIDNRLLDEKMEHAFRSTVMHEVGHAIYHDEYYYIDCCQLPIDEENEFEHLPCTSCEAKSIIGSTGNASRKLKTDTEWIEHQAKYFSAAALMPRRSMQLLCTTPTIQQFCFREHPGYENDALIAIVSKVYNVSYESAKIRLNQLRLAYTSQSPAPDSYFRTGNYYSIPLL